MDGAPSGQRLPPWREFGRPASAGRGRGEGRAPGASSGRTGGRCYSPAVTWSRRRERWAAERANPAIERAPERRQRFSTISDVAVSRLYGPWSWTDETPTGEAPGGGGPTAVDHLGEPLRRERGRWGDFDPLRDVGFPGEPPFTRGIHPTGYRARLWTMRMFAGFGSAEDTNARFQQLLDAGQTGPVDRLRHAHALRLRHRRSRGRGRVRHVRRGGVSSLADMEVLLDGPAARPRLDLDDDQLAGRADLGDVHRRRREGGRPARAARGHDPERHPQGVRGPEGVPLPARAVDAPGHRHDRVRHARDAALEHDLDQRLPHPRGRLDRGPGARVHDRRRHGLRRGGAARAACASTSSRRGSRSSSTATTTSSRRSPSSAPRGGSGGS